MKCFKYGHESALPASVCWFGFSGRPEFDVLVRALGVCGSMGKVSTGCSSEETFGLFSECSLIVL